MEAEASLTGQTQATTGSRSRVLPAYLALVAGIVCIAWSAIFVRWTDIPGAASAFYRMLVPALVLLPTHFLERERSRVSAKTLAIIGLGGLFFALALLRFRKIASVTS